MLWERCRANAEAHVVSGTGVPQSAKRSIEGCVRGTEAFQSAKRSLEARRWAAASSPSASRSIQASAWGGGSAERGIEAHDLRRGVIQSTRQHCGTCLATMDVLLTLQGVAWEHVPTEQGFFNPLSVQAHVQGTGLSNDPKYHFNTRLANMVCFNRLDIM